MTDRDAVAAKAQGRGYRNGPALPYRDTFTRGLRDRGYKPEDLPVAHSQMSELLSLPMYAELSAKQIEYVCAMLTLAVSRAAAAGE